MTLAVVVSGPYRWEAVVQKYGTVKWFNDTKGFGFIIPDDDSEELFVYYKDIAMTGFKKLAEGQRVQFLAEETPKGFAAKNVQVTQ